MNKRWSWTFAAALAAALVVGIALSARGASAVTAPVVAKASPRVLMTVKGQKQGAIAGEMRLVAGEYSPAATGAIAVYNLNYAVASPRDAASGLPTGKRQHKPMNVTIAWSKASPRLYAALTSNENLPEVWLTFYQPNRLGTGYQRYGYIKLTNANIASISEVVPGTGGLLESNTRDGSSTHVRHMEQIAMTFQQIEWTSDTGRTTAMDDWESPVAAGKR